MVLLPGCPCCSSLCSTNDSNGFGTYFNDLFSYNTFEAFNNAQWYTSGSLSGVVTLRSPGISITNDYIQRCTTVDLSRDFTIDVQVDAVTGYAIFSLEVASTLGVHSRFIVQGDYPSYVYFRNTAVTVFSGRASQGDGDIAYYKMVLSFVSGSWSAGIYLNSSLIWSGSCPLFSLSDGRFFHGVIGGNRQVTVKRYYMKLTYL